MIGLFRTPDVYFEEQVGPRPTRPVVSETTAFISLADYGPPAGAVRISSWDEFEKIFMFSTPGKESRSASRISHLSCCVQGYFSNGGTKAVIVQVPRRHRRHQRRGPLKDDLRDEPTDKEITRQLYVSAMKSLDDIRDISLLVTPDLQDPDVVETVLDYVRSRREFVYLLDPPCEAGVRDMTQLPSRYNSDFGALYYPWLSVASPSSRQGNSTLVPVPSTGHIAGVICRLDASNPRGVFSAPAGTIATIAHALGTSSEVTQHTVSELTPHNVNCIRLLATGKMAVWGTRTTSGQYINVRRGMTFVERSIREGLKSAH